MNDDLSKATRRDMQKLQRGYRQMANGDGLDMSIPALVEGVLAAISGMCALAWMVTLFLWVPDPVSGQLWFGTVMFGLVFLGGPLLVIYGLRRGGIDLLRAFVRGM